MKTAVHLKTIWWVFLGLAAVVMGGYAVWRSQEATATTRPVEVAPAQVGKHELHFAADAVQLSYIRVEAVPELPVPLLEPLPGRIAYDDDRTARISTPIAGRVVKIAVHAGDRVLSGQPLLWLDSPDYAQARADLARAESDARTRQAELGRAHTLFEGGVIPRKDFESAENDAAAARAELERARARFHNLSPESEIRSAAGYALRAPLAGVVTERQVNPGSEVRPDAATSLFVVSDPLHLWAMAELPEKDLAKVHVGQTVSVEVDAYPEQHFVGHVRSVSDVLDPQTRRVQVRCQVENPERRLKPEMFARIVPESDGQRLPQVVNSALVSEGLHSFIFVEKSPGVIEKRRVELAYRGHQVSFVSAGLRAGDRVVTSGALLLNAELGN